MNVEQIFIYFLMALGAILAVVFTATASLVMAGASAKAMRWFGEVDKVLMPLGNTATGQYINQQLRGIIPLVDSPDDKAVKTVLGYLGALTRNGLIDGKTLSTILSQGVGLAVELTDGLDVLKKDVPTTARFDYPYAPVPFTDRQSAMNYAATLPASSPMRDIGIPIQMATDFAGTPAPSQEAIPPIEEDKNAQG